jgi:hypothetical protein
MNTLLKKVAFVSRKPQIVTDLSGKEVEVKNTFAYNPNSKTSPETAKSWAASYSFNNEDAPVSIEDNTPFYARIVDLEERGCGGRAYRVIDEKSREFDLREDQMKYIISEYGIEKTGKIPVPLLWGIYGTSTKLVALGSPLWAEMKKNSELESEISAGTPDLSSLRPGSLVTYRYRGKIFEAVYIGEVKMAGEKKRKHHFFFELDRAHLRRNFDRSKFPNLESCSAQEITDFIAAASTAGFGNRAWGHPFMIGSWPDLKGVVKVDEQLNIDIPLFRNFIPAERKYYRILTTPDIHEWLEKNPYPRMNGYGCQHDVYRQLSAAHDEAYLNHLRASMTWL